MKFQHSKVAHATTLLLASIALSATAQTAPNPSANLGGVVITGIRASLEQSIENKRNADTNVEVVTAEDVGKMPDKNIADALSRLPGVNVQFGGALAMDEAERVAIRGTSPNLNLVTLNGHALASGDWHVGDQGSSGRSVGFGLMPSQLIGKSIVYKTGRADITEGGIAGTVDIQTRKPLDFKKQLTGEVALGVVHASLPNTTDPQASGLIAWKNEASTLGILVQAFKENRHLRRDGQETFSFGVISESQAAASGNPALAGKRMPGSLNSAMFEGVRERTGGYLGVQAKPIAGLEVNLSSFQAKLKADNYNSSAFALPTGLVGQGWLIKNAKIDGDVIVSADIVRPTFTAASTQADLNRRVIGLQFDHNSREGAQSLSSFTDADVKYNFTDTFTARARIGITEGSGVTNTQPSLTYGIVNPNMAYAINGNRPTDYALTNYSGSPIDLSKPSNYSQMSNMGASVNSTDKENYLHLDFDKKVDVLGFTNLKFGMRSAKHDRSYDVVAPRWNAQDTATGAPASPSPFISVTGGLLVNAGTLPVYTNGTLSTQPVTVGNIVPNGAAPTPTSSYPGNYAAGLDAKFPRDLFRFDPAAMQAFANQYAKWDAVSGKTWTSGYTVTEKNQASYFMAEFEGNSQWSGNVGLRYAETDLDSLSYQALPPGTGLGQCAPLQPCAIPGAIVGSRFATYLPQLVTAKTSTLLPSLNLRYAVDKNLIARFGFTKTMGRANYNELAGNISLNNTLLTGSTGNPLLKPVTSENVDATLAWYFAPRAYLSGGIFSQSLSNYVKNGTAQVEYFNTSTGTDSIYTVTTKVGVGAQLRGAELAFELPIAAGFGVGGNTTYVKSEDSDGVDMLGSSKWTHNLRGFYEDDKLSASLAWNYRTDYSIGYVGNGTNIPLKNANGVVTQVNGLHYYKGYGSVSLSVGYKLKKDLSIHFDGNNLTDPVRSTYFVTDNAPGYWHQSGRQYFVNLRMKF